MARLDLRLARSLERGGGEAPDLLVSVTRDAASRLPTDAVCKPANMITLCRTSEVPDGGGLRVVLPGFEPLAVFRAGSDYFVVSDECTHGAASLSEGEVIGEEIECPFHHGAFSLRTGRPTAAPCSVPLRTYPVEVRGNVIYMASPARR
jgi:nitrite reductase/ring-hydroxylating ferredoxin subunit